MRSWRPESHTCRLRAHTRAPPSQTWPDGTPTRPLRTHPWSPRTHTCALGAPTRPPRTQTWSPITQICSLISETWPPGIPTGHSEVALDALRLALEDVRLTLAPRADRFGPLDRHNEVHTFGFVPKTHVTPSQSRNGTLYASPHRERAEAESARLFPSLESPDRVTRPPPASWKAGKAV